MVGKGQIYFQTHLVAIQTLVLNQIEVETMVFRLVNGKTFLSDGNQVEVK